MVVAGAGVVALEIIGSGWIPYIYFEGRISRVS